MVAQAFRAWGRLARVEHETLRLEHRDARLPLPDDAATPVLPRGNGRSYGDSNLNPGGALILATDLDRYIRFDDQAGVLECEAGVLLSDILRLVVPRGWFLPVVPGTSYVTVGGAIANDVHGKNHHTAGSFGQTVHSFTLARSDGSVRTCSPDENADWFAATIGGLGLTGTILTATLQLRRIASPLIDAESIRYHSVAEFLRLCDASERDYEYTVSWIDCASGGKKLGRGLYSRGNHAPVPDAAFTNPTKFKRFPVDVPFSFVNPLSVRAFNALYFHKQRQDAVRLTQHYRGFFFPLDGILEWNRMYGPRGFYQYQCVIPEGAAAGGAIEDMLRAIAKSRQGSFLAVLKRFGALRGKGLLSFPMPGLTLALDFPNTGDRLHRLFDELDAVVAAAGGRLYPAKDARMGATLFRAGYPEASRFAAYVDPRHSSGFWKRVSASL